MTSKLIYSKKEINRAGDILCGKNTRKTTTDSAIEILENFRSIHVKPLGAFRILIQRHAEKIESEISISQRLKRAPSIIRKLKIQGHMSLSQMQDIGGLRAVVNSKQEVEKLYNLLKISEQQPAFKSTFLKKFDYISYPKKTGYRSLHLVYKYNKNVPANEQCRIELQIRTKIQHAWATAIEVLGTYLNQPLKQNFGDKELLELFNSISKCFALIEDNSIDKDLFVNTLKQIKDSKLEELLMGYTVSSDIVIEDNKKTNNKFHLITLNLKKRMLNVRSFSKSKFDDANNEYSELEKKYINNNEVEVVLVSVDDIKSLSKLYPNYFMDTHEFLKIIELMKQKTLNTNV